MTVTIPINTTPAPSRVDTPNFAVRADAYHAWLPGAVAAMNAQNVENNTLATAAQVASAAAVAASAVVTATNPITNATAAAASATAAAASASATSTAAASAAAAKDLAIAAWAASTAPTEQLAGIGKMLHGGAVVKSIIYDTSKDFDGGEWRKRCSDKSWYTEALGGSAWIGQQPNEAYARAYVGSKASPELVINGTFNADTSNWTAMNGGSISWDAANSRMMVTRGATAGMLATQTITTIIGKTYRYSVQQTSGTGGLAYFSISSVSGAANLAGTGAGTNSYYGTFVATSVTTYVQFGINIGASGDTAYVDNYSIQLVDSTVDTSNCLYQSTGDGRFYKTISTSGATEVFRGITREFPALVAIVAEAYRVVIYDLTQANCPMWRSFVGSNVAYPYWFKAVAGDVISSLAAANGVICFGTIGNDQNGLHTIELVRDRLVKRCATTSENGFLSPLTRSVSNALTVDTGITGIATHTVTAVAITALENAPIDLYTGMPTPTIAVATAGGVSVIKQDGTVLNSLNTERVDSVGFVGSTLFMGNRYATADTFRFQELSSIAASWVPTSGMGYLFSGGAEDQSQIVPTAPYVFHRLDSAFTLNKLNKSFPSKSMRARVTNAYNTGWQVGDSRLATLSSTTAETVTDGSGTDLVTNGTFATDTSGWTSGNSALSVVSGAMRVTIAAGGASGTAFQLITGLLVGRTYTVSLTFATGTSFAASISLGTGGVNGADYAYSGLSAGVNTLSFTATAANLGITLSNDGGSTGQYNDFDNISCKVTSEMINNGTFTTDTSGWTAGGGATISAVSGALRVTSDATGTQAGYAYQTFTTVVGRSYVVTLQITAGTASDQRFRVGYTGANTNQYGEQNGVGSKTLNFVANTTSTTISVGQNVLTASVYSTFDNISVKLAEPDRSVKNNGLVLNGTLTKTAVASGANLVSYSGFSANTNYLSQPYSANLDFGTGDFAFGFWTDASAPGVMFTRGNGTSAGSIMWYQNGGGLTAAFYIHDGTSLAARLTVTLPSGLSNIWITRLGTTLSVYSNGALLGTVTSTLTVSNATAALQIGNRQDASQTYGGWVSLFRASAAAPSADQIAHIYRTELPLFQAGAQCTIAGTSTSVTALSYDEGTDMAHVGTSWGRSGFRDLLRVESEATTSSTLSSLSSVDGVVLTGSTTSGYVSAPSMYLRDEIRRKGTASKALAKQLIWQEFYATAGQTVFTLAKNGDVRAVYVNGIVRKSPADYSVSSDGFQNIITFTSGISAGIQVSVQTTRS